MALQTAWPFVKKWCTIRSVSKEVQMNMIGNLDEAGLPVPPSDEEDAFKQLVSVRFAITSAWPYVHGWGDKAAKQELLDIMRNQHFLSR